MSVRSETIKFHNPTSHTLKLYAVGLEDVPPGGDVEVPMELCVPGRSDSGARKKSIIEDVCPQLVPVADHDKELLGAVPAPLPVTSKVVTVARHPVSAEPPGVKALREKREAAIQATKASVEAQASNQKAPAVPAGTPPANPIK